MIEIDGVTVTLGHHPSWEVVDMLCDTYDGMLELVTRPGFYTNEMDESVERKLGRLLAEDDLIRRTLGSADSDGMARFFQGKEAPELELDSITLAYDSVLSQVSEIRYSRLLG